MKPVKELRKGDYIIHRNEPCIVLRKENVAYSTHSHTKVKIDVQGLFTNFLDTLAFMPHANVEDVDIIRKRGQLISKAPVQVMDLVSYETMNAEAPEEVLSALNDGDEVTFVEHGGVVMVLEKRA